MLTADIGITSDWITIGFPTSNGSVHWRETGGAAAVVVVVGGGINI